MHKRQANRKQVAMAARAAIHQTRARDRSAEAEDRSEKHPGGLCSSGSREGTGNDDSDPSQSRKRHLLGLDITIVPKPPGCSQAASAIKHLPRPKATHATSGRQGWSMSRYLSPARSRRDDQAYRQTGKPGQDKPSRKSPTPPQLPGVGAVKEIW